MTRLVFPISLSVVLVTVSSTRCSGDENSNGVALVESKKVKALKVSVYIAVLLLESSKGGLSSLL